MKRILKVLLVVVILIIGYYTYLYIKEETTDYGYKVVVCIPVYGQSLALGEEATRITDFEKLKNDYEGRILTENLNYDFGYFESSPWKKFIKKLVRYRKRSFELSVYRMAECLANELGKDTAICIFPGGRGATIIKKLSKGSNPYHYFLTDIRTAYEKAQKRGWGFYVPAICWMQGESDIIDYSKENYKMALKQIQHDFNEDIKAITKQKEDIRLICYQTNVVTIAKNFNQRNYDCVEMEPSQAIVDLINKDALFEASGPTYPYNYVRENLHIDGIGQQHIGFLDAITIINFIRGKDKTYGLIPQALFIEGNDILIKYRVPYPPLVIDTVSVALVDHYGFCVIDRDGDDIVKEVSIEDDAVRLICTKSPVNCKVRYAVNGDKKKSGHIHGPRGNLRDSQGEEKQMTIAGKAYPIHNWSYQFDMHSN